MSSLFVAVILVGCVVLIAMSFVTIEKRKKRNHMNRFLLRLSELGSLNHLAFSSQEILKDNAIALDGVHRKLLVLTPNSNIVLHLNDIKTCSVKKQYGSIHADSLKGNRLERFLERIVLHFELKNGTEAVEVVFYDHIPNHLYEIKEMNEKANYWEAILSKMIKAPFKEAA